MDNSAQEHIDRGIKLVAEGRYKEAIDAFEMRLAFTSHPVAMSYYGLCLATAEKNFEQAINLCLMAIKREGDNMDLYVNFGKVFILDRQKTLAVRVWKKGLKIDPEHLGLNVEMEKIGIRRKPFIPFLSREHFINRQLGLLTYWWQMRLAGRATAL